MFKFERFIIYPLLMIALFLALIGHPFTLAEEKNNEEEKNYFAPADFVEMEDSEKLSTPDFDDISTYMDEMRNIFSYENGELTLLIDHLKTSSISSSEIKVSSVSVVNDQQEDVIIIGSEDDIGGFIIIRNPASGEEKKLYIVIHQYIGPEEDYLELTDDKLILPFFQKFPDK